MTINLWRLAAPIFLCACLITSIAVAEEPADETKDVPANAVAELYHVDQSERLAALTDEQMQTILSRVEQHRGDAFEASLQRSGRSHISDDWSAKKN